jgi:hypothetical protein
MAPLVLWDSPSPAATIGGADFVRGSGLLRDAFIGRVMILQGIPFLMGGTNNMTRIRTIAEIEE